MSTLKYEARYDGAEWHTVYRSPLTGEFVSVMCGGSEQTHRQDAADRQATFDRAQAAQQRELALINGGGHRKLAPWYDEREAS